MLTEMTWTELMEWRAYFVLRDKEAKKRDKPRPGQDRAALGRITGSLMGYQNRRNKGKNR
jgi:hypothetical protein